MSDLLSVIARDWHLLVPVGVVGALSWSIWLIRKVLSSRYRPTLNDFRTTTSVVVPSFREDPDVLERCLDTWLAQGPTEVIVVLDVEDREAFRRLTARGEPRLTVVSFAHEGKRYRSLGDSDITFPIASSASSIEEIIAELETTRVPERAGRAMDHEAEDAFERLRTDGYM